MAFIDDVIAAFPEFGLDTATAKQGHAKLAVVGTHKGQKIVLKVLKEPLPPHDADDETEEPEAIQGERFRREVLAMRRVKNRRVVEIVLGPEVREIGGQRHLWYVEPYYPAVLEDRIGAPWAEEKVVALANDVIDGLIALVGCGLVHRDIKPANIGLDGDGRPVLLDLGAVLFSDLTTYTVGVAPHTKTYAAPEQLFPRRHGVVDVRTDLFALGIVMYRLLTGVHPFGSYAADPPAYEARLVRGQYAGDPLTKSGCSEAMRDVIDRLLKPRPNQRFRKISHLRAALNGCKQ